MSSSVSCTFGGRNSYNNGWLYSSCSTTTGYGHGGFCKDTYGHNRCIVLKITTPSFSGGTNKKLEVKIAMCRSSSAGAGTDTFNYRITTTTPAFSEGGATQITFPSSYISSGTIDVYSPSQSSGYTYNTIELDAGDIQSSTTYYIWLWSDTPYASGSSNYIGYYAHHSSYGGLITVNLLYDEGCAYIYNGSSWVQVVPYIYNGSSWVQAVPYIYNGSSWIATG